MKNSEIKTISLILSGVIGIILGYILDRLINIPYFIIDKNINVLQLLSILTTIAIGIYINIIINKRNEKNVHLKKIFIEKINELELQLVSLSDMVNTGKFDIHIIISKSTTVKRGLTLLKDYNVLSPEEYNICQEIIDSIKDRITVSGDFVKIVKNTVEITNTIISEVTDSLNRLKRKLFDNKIQVIKEISNNN